MKPVMSFKGENCALVVCKLETFYDISALMVKPGSHITVMVPAVPAVVSKAE